MTGFWSPLFRVLSTSLGQLFRPIIDSAPEWLRKHIVLSEKPMVMEVSAPDEFDLEPVRAATDIDILLSEKLSLVHHMAVPIEAKGEVARVVAMEAERIMPLKIKKLHIAHSVLDGANAEGLRVLVVAVRKSLIDGLLSKASRHDLKVRSISASVCQQVVSLDISELKRRQYWKVLCVCTAFLMFFAIIGKVPRFYFDHLVSGVAETDIAIGVVKKQTSQIAGLQKQVQDLQNLTEAVQSARDRNRMLSLLAELTDASPDSVVFDELRIDGDRLYVSGRSTAPEEWVIQLQENTMFEGVRLTSVLGQQDGSRRFEVHMQVKWNERAGL